MCQALALLALLAISFATNLSYASYWTDRRDCSRFHNVKNRNVPISQEDENQYFRYDVSRTSYLKINNEVLLNTAESESEKCSVTVSVLAGTPSMSVCGPNEIYQKFATAESEAPLVTGALENDDALVKCDAGVDVVVCRVVSYSVELLTDIEQEIKDEHPQWYIRHDYGMVVSDTVSASVRCGSDYFCRWWLKCTDLSVDKAKKTFKKLSVHIPISEGLSDIYMHGVTNKIKEMRDRELADFAEYQYDFPA